MRIAFRSGFTLLELSVVMVVIALIIGAVMIGQSLIRSSQIQSVITDVAKYTQAINNFRDKYGALPGDFAGAEAIWGSDTNCPNTPYISTPHTATCNGNGDGAIGYGANPAPNVGAPWVYTYEIVRAWQQLGNAGFIQGSYTGTGNAATPLNCNSQYQFIPGVNTPVANIAGGAFTLFEVRDTTGGAFNWPMMGRVIQLGSVPQGNVPNAGAGSYPCGPVVTPAEALGLDIKMDDGLPATGNVVAMKRTVNPNCVRDDVSESAASASYNTVYNGTACSPLFVSGF